VADFKDNKYFNPYKIISSPDWVYKSDIGTYSTEFIIIEDKIIFEKASGKPSLDDTKKALKILKSIVDQKFTYFKPHVVSDSREIKGADGDVRKYVAEFHRNHPVFESISLITSTFTKALFSIVKNLGIGDFKHWKVYRNEKYCIDEILEGEIIIGQSQNNNNEYDLIYKALADISTNKFSYDKLIDKTKNNEELSSAIQAIQLIKEENKLKADRLDLTVEVPNTEIQSSSILFKSILENTDTVVALMDEEFDIINTNANFNEFFNAKEVKEKNLTQFLKIEEINYKILAHEHRTKFISKYEEKTISCKLYKIENLGDYTYTIFIGEDISEKENLKASEQKLLNELQEQNFKLLKVNHLLSHEINHQIASLSQILNEFKISTSRDSNLEQMISKVQNDLNLSLSRVNNTLFNSDQSNYQVPIKDENLLELENLKIALIDDDEITNLLNTKVLSKNLPECELKVFQDARLALSSIEQKEYLPDIILLDLYMPEMNGFEFLKSFSKLEFEIIPMIFMLSSSRDPEEIAMANSFNTVKAYFTKPLSKDKIKDILKTYELDVPLKR